MLKRKKNGEEQRERKGRRTWAKKPQLGPREYERKKVNDKKKIGKGILKALSPGRGWSWALLNQHPKQIDCKGCGT